MGANDATVIVGTLSDEQLVSQINKLVNTVDSKTKAMSKSFDNFVDHVNNRMKEIGNIKIDSGTASDSGSTKAVNAQKELGQEIERTTKKAKEQKLTFDQTAQAFQNATAPKSARDSFYAFVQGYKEQAQHLAQLIPQAEQVFNQALGRKIMEVNQQISTATQSLRRMYGELESAQYKANKTGDFSGVNQKLQEIKTLESYIESLRQKLANIPTITLVSTDEGRRLTALREEYNKVTNAMREDVVAQQKEVAMTDEQKEKLAQLQERLKQVKEERKAASKAFQDAGWDRFGAKLNAGAYPDDVNAQNKLANAERTLADATQRLNAIKNEQAQIEKEIKSIINGTTDATQKSTEATKTNAEQIKKQAQAIRESQQWREKGYAMVGERVYYDPERSVAPARNRLSLEEQILNTQKEEELAAIRRANAERQEAAEKSALEQSSSRRLVTEKQITEEQEKRSKPKSFATYDDLQQSIAHVLGLQKQQVKIVDEEVESYNKLSSALKQYKQAYYALTESERNSENGKNLLRRIHEIERAAQKLQSQMSRPISLKSVMGLSENTLDDIAYKMRQLQAYRQGIDLTKPTAANEIKEVDNALNRLQKDADKWMNKQKSMIDGNNALGRSWNYMKNRLAFYFTVGASTQFVKNLIEVRSQYEMNERALGILINSAERGTQVFNQLSQMALVSPYTLIELSSAAKQMTAYDIAAKDVVDTTRRLADMASAVGVPMERLTYALGQIKAYGYLNSRDARMFANAGIPLVKQLSDYYTQLEGKMVSVGDVYDRMKKKAIDFNDVMAVVTKMTDEGGKFFDFQAKMADTLKVRLANLTLAWNNMLNEMGEETQGVLSFGIQGLKELFLRWKDINSALTKIIVTLGVIKGAQMLWYIAAYNTNKAIALQTVLGAKLATTMKTAAMAMASLATNPMTWIGVAVAAVGSLVYTIIEGNKAMKEFNKTLRQGAENNFNDVKNFVEQYKELRESLFKTVEKTSGGKNTSVPTKRYQDIDENEAKKAWEAVREQIELSTRSSDEYISRLLTITNMSDRLRESFNILDDINVVNAALKEMDDDTIAIANDWSAWWNLWKAPDGLVKNLNQYTDALNKVNKEYGSLENLSKKVASGNIAAVSAFADVEAELLAFKNDIDETNKSILNFINLKGWSGDTNKINQVFKQISEKLIEENQLDPQKAFSIQIEMENARAAAAKQALSQRIADEKAALAVAASEETKAEIQERLNALLQEERDFSDHNGRNKVEWERFTKWLKEQHLSEMTEMFRGMDAEQIKSLNFQEGKHADWVKRMVEKYAKEHKMSYDDAFSYLKSWVSKANTWSIFIPLTISTEDEKSVFKNLEEADKAADEAWKKMQRLDKRIAQLKKKGARNVGQEGLVADATDEDKEYTKALQERADAQRDYNKAVEEGGESKKENAAGAKAQKAAESELQKAIKEELQLIDNIRNAYKKMDEEGVGHFEAVQKSTSGLEESIKHVNSVLSKYGIGQIDFSKFAGVQNPRAIIDMLNKQIDNLLKSGVAKPEEVKDLEIKVSSMKLDVTSFDQKTITESLNSELARLKDEYELSVALDADPELGDMFANWIGFDPSLLTSSVQEYANEYTRLLNKYLKEKGSDLELPSLDLTDDDIREFERMVKDNTMNKEWVEAIKKGVTEIRNLRRKDAEDTSKEWNKLIEKYGGLQAKMVKIYKDTVNEQINIAKKFGSNEEITAALDLSRRINISQDPEEIARLQTELSKIMDKVVENNPKAINVYTATQNKQGKETAKANWEDFKDSNLYAMTFEDMENVSTRAIKSIIDKLDDLKDKVGEDPASMKALVKSIEDARKELEKRNPFAAIVQGNKEWTQAIKELEHAQEELQQAQNKVDGARIALANAKAAGSAKDVEAAQKKLNKAIEERATAEENVIVAENKLKKANGKIISGLQNLSGKLNDIKGLFDTVSQLFREFGGDDGTADAIDEISKGFTIMTTIIMGVVAAMILLETTQPWLLAIAAALSVIVGLVSFLSGQHNKNIDKKVKASELAVKRLENAYIDLEQAADRAYGTATIGAQKAMLANKELQLAELRRQLQLERSRKSKDRDQDKIEDLKKQIKELEYEISNGTKKIVDDLLGVSSAGSFAEDLVSSMIESFRQGEDYMKVFEEKFEDMIDNMIMKAIVSRVVSSYIDKLWDNLDQQIAQRSKAEADAYAAAQAKNSTVKNMTDEEMKWMMVTDGMNFTYGMGFRKEEYDAYRKAVQEAEDAAKKRLEAAETFTDSDMDYVMAQIAEIMPELGEKLKSIIGEYYKFGDKAENATLSALQQGIQGITEDTAGALEAYMNGVSQQVYLQSSILMEIRDVVIGMNGDVGLGVQAQMLLQLQQSYVVQTAIQNILAGVVNPSGRAFSVEIIS